MTDIKVGPRVDGDDYVIERITVSRIPDIDDSTGDKLLNNLEEAVKVSRDFISQGFRLTDLWAKPGGSGIEFVLKRSK